MFEPIASFRTVDVAQRFDGSMLKTLKEVCDDVTTYTEGGQFYIMGWKGSKRIVFAHADPKVYQAMMHPESIEDMQRYPGYRG